MDKRHLRIGKYYEIEGTKLPSVTTILDVCTPPELIAWFKSTSFEEQTEISKKALNTGREIHSMIEAYLKTGVMPRPVDDVSTKCSTAFLEFEASVGKIQPIAVECTVHTKSYAGTADCIARVGTKLAVIDIKTSKRIYESYELQMASYAHAWCQMHDELPEDLYCVRLDKETGVLEVKKYQYDPEVLKIFLAHLTVFNWYEMKRNERNGDSNATLPSKAD